MYTIQFLDDTTDSTFAQRRFQQTLQETILQDGRFRVGAQHWGTSTLTRKERAQAGVEVWKVMTLYLQRIRLTTPKPYCGNHPGPCVVGFLPRKKPTASYLEWDDWVAFHTLVNQVCDNLQVSANIWTLPPDAKGKMWIRKGTQARQRWDYQDDWSRGGLQPLRVWNTGTPDQFTQTH